MDLSKQILEYVVEYPVLATIIAVMGVCRLVFKPLVSAIQAVIKKTETKKDDAFLAKAMKSWWYKAVAWVINYLGSLKLPKAEQPKNPPS